MRTMKDSGIEWIGKIPQAWELHKIKIDFDIVAGATPKSGESSYWDGEIPWVTPADYTTEDIYVSGGRKSITQEGLNSCATSMIPAGSIIFSKRAPVGLVAINSNPLCTNQGCLACVPHDNVNAKYFYYVMSIFGEQFELFASGTTFKEISADTFANFKLPFPDYETQKKIADYLDSKCSEIDALIMAKGKTNALLRERRQSIIYEAVTKGLDPAAPMKESGVKLIGEIPSQWSICHLKNVASIFGRIGFRGYTAQDLVSEGEGAITLSPSNLSEMQMDYSKCTYISWEKYEESPEIQIKKGDILFVKTGSSFGKSSLVNDLPEKATINPQLIVIRAEAIDPLFLIYSMQSSFFMAQVDMNIVGGTIPTIAQEKILNFNLILPHIETQKEIVSHLEKHCKAIDRLVRINEITIQKLKEYRRSMIFEAVTGKFAI